MSCCTSMRTTMGRSCLITGALVACACVLLPAAHAGAAATKSVVGVFGEAQGGVREGLFERPKGIAVNQSSGDFYVADATNNRIQQFTSSGEFIRAWGVGVAASGPDALGTNEVVSLTVAATGGSYKLNYEGLKFGSFIFGGYTTEPLAYDAQASTVQAALEALKPFAEEGATVTVTGGPGDATGSKPFEITFGGSVAGVENTFTPVATELSGTATATVTTHATAPFEICSAQRGDTCRAGIKSAIAGGMAEPVGVAVEQANGNVYVTDEGNHRVDVYSASGAFEGAFGWGVATGASELQFCTSTCEAGQSGAGAGEFGYRIGYIAINPTTGDVYVSDPSNQRVEKFMPTLAAGAVTGIEFVKEMSGLNEPSGIAVDGQGFVYVLDEGNRRVEKLDSAGDPAGFFATAQLTGEFGQRSNAIAVDPSSGNVLVATVCTEVTCPEAPLPVEQNASMETRLLEFNSSGELLATHGTLAGIAVEREASVLGVAFGKGGNVYLSSTCWTQANPQRVFALNTPVAPEPTVSAPTGVTSGGAVLHGTVNPNEIAANRQQTEYVFEISEDGGQTWRSLPATAGSTGASSVPVAVTQTVGGLEAATTYEVRLHAQKQFAGGSATSTASEFSTASAVPAVSGASAINIEADSALLRAQVNPDGLATTYRFEYGVGGSYEASLPANAEEAELGASSGAVSVSAHPQSLRPGTLYSYRVVAENSKGSGEATGTFTTSEAILPGASTAAATSVAQNTAVVAGTVRTEGQPTTYGFEIGTAPGEYGPATGLGHLGAGLGETSVSLDLTGLAPGTTYYYRVSASDVYGTSHGAVRSFTTATFQSAQVVPPAPLPFVSVPSTAFPTQAGGTAGKSKAKKKTRRHKARAHSRKQGSKRCAKRSRGAKRRRAKCRGKARKM